MIIYKDVDLNEDVSLTDEQKQMLEKLENVEPEPTEDCPELTEEQYNQLMHISKMYKKIYERQGILLPLSPKTMQKAKSLGKEYISILSKILENVLNDSELVKMYL